MRTPSVTRLRACVCVWLCVVVVVGPLQNTSLLNITTSRAEVVTCLVDDSRLTFKADLALARNAAKSQAPLLLPPPYPTDETDGGGKQP